MLDKEGIKQIIPHREPFLLFDELIELKDKSATGIKYVSEDEYYFKGHFPEQPVMPGVLIVESLAQVGGMIALSNPEHKGKKAYLVGIKDAKFRRMVVPGDKLVLKVTLSNFRRSFGYGEGKAYVDGELACEATISFAIR